MISNIFLAVGEAMPTTMSNTDLAGIFAIIASMILVVSIISIALYVYGALTLQTIGKKLGYKNSWLAWIPFANHAMILELGDFHWALVFLLLVPILGWLAFVVLTYISLWRILEKRNYPGWLVLLSLLAIVPILNFLVGIGILVLMGLVAWKDR